MVSGQQFNKEAIDAHNVLRKRHGCPDLAYDSVLAKSAQAYADKLAKLRQMKHSNGGDYGENLASRSSSDTAEMSGAEATLMWYGEIRDYSFNGRENMACGHFSQVVWKDTKQAGFGVAKTSDGKSIFVVGQYKPAGNFVGQWASQVPKPLNGKKDIPTVEELMRKPETQRPIISVQNPNGFIGGLMESLNAHRQLKNLPNLEIGTEVAALAQSYADKLQAREVTGKCSWNFNGAPLAQFVECSYLKSKKPSNVAKRCIQKCSTDVESHETAGIGYVLNHRPRRSQIVVFFV